MKKYVCDLCGYIYDEAAGDPDNAPITAWPPAPSGRTCPRTGCAPCAARTRASFLSSNESGARDNCPGLLSLSKNLCSDESARVLAGELEGAAARLEWDRMP